MKNWDCIKILTKEQIIEYLNRNHSFRAPEKSQIIFFKYMKTAEKLQQEMQEYLDNPEQARLAKEIDILTAKFNSSSDTKEKLKILDEREKTIKLFWEHEEKYKIIELRQEQNRKEYEEAMKNV